MGILFLFDGWQNKIQWINLKRELGIIEKTKAIIRKYQNIIFIIISVILIAVSWFIGDQTATTKIENEKVTYEEMIQKLDTVSRIFCRDQVYFFESTQNTQCNIFQISDWGG